MKLKCAPALYGFAGALYYIPSPFNFLDNGQVLDEDGQGSAWSAQVE